MNRRLALISIAVVALNTGVVGGRITSALADEAAIESRVGELRGAVLSLLAPAGAVATRRILATRSVTPKQLLIASAISASLAFGLHDRSFAAGDHPASAICGWIGVGVKPMTAVFAESLGMVALYGAIFDRPEAGSPAASVGIEMGDVLTTVNGNPLEKWSDFAGTIASLAPGDTVYLAIRRNGQLLEVAPMVGQGKCP
jgi:S1-C subfamily serine protease